MAALLNRSDFWYLSIDDVVNIYMKHNRKDVITFAWIQGVVLCLISPFIIFGNAFVIYAVWKDPFKNLHSWPSNLILQCMAVTDLLVGVVLAPMQGYWLFSQAVTQRSAFSFQILMSLSAILVGVSLAHVFVLSIDRLIAVMKPLSYKFIMTRARILFAISVLWLYFICFGILVSCLRNSIFIVTMVFNVQMYVILQITFVFYGIIVCRLRSNHREWHKRILQGSVRVTQQEQFVDAERRLAKSMAFVIVFSFFFITPFFVLFFLLYFCVECYSYPRMFLVSTGVEITLLYLNSVGKPLVYCWRLPKYREIAKHCFKTISRCRIAIEKTYRRTETIDTIIHAM